MKLLLAFTIIFISLYTIACSQKQIIKQKAPNSYERQIKQAEKAFKELDKQ